MCSCLERSTTNILDDYNNSLALCVVASSVYLYVIEPYVYYNLEHKLILNSQQSLTILIY